MTISCLALLAPSPAGAAPVDVRFLEGVTRGFLVLRSTTGQTLAQGCFPDPRVTVNPGKVQNLAGKRLNNAPQFKFNIGGEYDFPLGGTGLGGLVTVNYRWQDRINFSLNQDPVTVQPAYGVFDGSIGVTAGEGKYKLTAFVNNLFNVKTPGCVSCDLNNTDPTIYNTPGRFYYARIGVRISSTSSSAGSSCPVNMTVSGWWPSMVAKAGLV